MLSKIPRGRFVTVDEIANLIAWIASAENSFTTGATFDISGGRAQPIDRSQLRSGQPQMRPRPSQTRHSQNLLLWPGPEPAVLFQSAL